MAVKFRKDLPRLIRDLQACGYPVLRVEQIPGAQARTTDVILPNGLMVSWDAVTGRVWAEGPQPTREKLDRILRRLYHPSGWVRACTRRYEGLVSRLRSDGSPTATASDDEPALTETPPEKERLKDGPPRPDGSAEPNSFA